MRRNFAQVLREGKINIQNEYSKLYTLFYGKNDKDGKSIADIISMNFLSVNFRGTCLTFDEFNKAHDINFTEHPQNFDIDYLVSFCEYFFNFLISLEDSFFFRNFDKYAHISHILTVVEAIGYMQSQEAGFTIFVPKDSVAVSVSESDLIPDNVSYKVIAYNHYSMKGDLDSKRQILLVFSNLLEPQRKKLEEIDKKFASDLFFAFNNFNVRHNNVDPSGPKYKKPIGDLSEKQLEHWYDEIYQMSLLAFLRLEHVGRKKDFDDLKDKIENKTS